MRLCIECMNVFIRSSAFSYSRSGKQLISTFDRAQIWSQSMVNRLCREPCHQAVEASLFNSFPVLRYQKHALSPQITVLTLMSVLMRFKDLRAGYYTAAVLMLDHKIDLYSLGKTRFKVMAVIMEYCLWWHHYVAAGGLMWSRTGLNHNLVIYI